MQSVYTVLIFLATAGSSFAQQMETATLTGTVTARKSPLPGATIQLTGTRFGAITDTVGVYRIADIPPGNYGEHQKVWGN